VPAASGTMPDSSTAVGPLPVSEPVPGAARPRFALLRAADRLIALAVGEENTLVRNFCRVVVPLALVLIVGLIAKTAWLTDSPSTSLSPKLPRVDQPPPKLPRVDQPPPKLPSRDAEISLDLGNGVTLDMVLIPAGSFTMGDDSGDSDERPAHRVAISKPFYLGKYEVTQEQWEAVMGSNPSHFKGPKNPVEEVSWDDCQTFVAKVNAKYAGTGRQFTLPTEAQWEYACRAGSTTQYSLADDEGSLGDYAWFAGNSGGRTHPVGQKKPNAFGLYDMHGNVWEWCQDRYDSDYYGNSPTDDPTGAASGSYRVLRGGGWLIIAWSCRSAFRFRLTPDDRYDYLGFRLASVPVDASSSR